MHGERTVQAAAIKWLGSLGWTVLDGPDITPDTPRPERSDYGEVVVHGRLRSAPARLGPDLPDHALDDSLRQLTRPGGARLAAGNRDVHRILVAGVKVEYAHADDGLGVPAAYRAAPTTTIICDHSDSYICQSTQSVSKRRVRGRVLEQRPVDPKSTDRQRPPDKAAASHVIDSRAAG